jgi:hypothetical protein
MTAVAGLGQISAGPSFRARVVADLAALGVLAGYVALPNLVERTAARRLTCHGT